MEDFVFDLRYENKSGRRRPWNLPLETKEKSSTPESTTEPVLGTATATTTKTVKATATTIATVTATATSIIVVTARANVK